MAAQPGSGALRDGRGVGRAGRAARASGSARAAGVLLLATTELADVEAALEAARYALVVVDSIQTMRAAELESAPGSVAQLREVAGAADRARQAGAARRCS